MPLFLLLSAQLSLPVISRKIITPPDHTYGTVSVRNIYCNMCWGRAGHKPWAWLAPCRPWKDALVPPTGAFSWRGGVRVPAAVSPSWLGDSWLIALGGLGPRGILCLLGGPCLCQPVPNLVPKGCPQAGGWAAEMGGGGCVQSPSW